MSEDSSSLGDDWSALNKRRDKEVGTKKCRQGTLNLKSLDLECLEDSTAPAQNSSRTMIFTQEEHEKLVVCGSIGHTSTNKAFHSVNGTRKHEQSAGSR